MSENLNTSSVTIGSESIKVNSNNAMHNHDEEPASKRSKTEDNNYDESESTPKSRAIRLEQNRRAAKESRRRKKMMIAELQRSVIFFSRSNGTLKQQNDELSRLLLQAQSQVAAMESGQQPQNQPQQQVSAPVANIEPSSTVTRTSYADLEQQAQAQAAATQAIFERQGFPPAAARAAAQTMNATPARPDSPTAGSTMKAMASFQQAAAAAMQAAMGMNPAASYAASQASSSSSLAPVGGATSMMSFNDTLQHYAMQRQEGAAAGPFAFYQPFMAPLSVVWQQLPPAILAPSPAPQQQQQAQAQQHQQ